MYRPQYSLLNTIAVDLLFKHFFMDCFRFLLSPNLCEVGPAKAITETGLISNKKLALESEAFRIEYRNQQLESNKQRRKLLKATSALLDSKFQIPTSTWSGLTSEPSALQQMHFRFEMGACPHLHLKYHHSIQRKIQRKVTWQKAKKGYPPFINLDPG